MADRYDEVLSVLKDVEDSVNLQNISITKLEVQMSIIKWVGGVMGGAIILFILGKVSSVVF